MKKQILLIALILSAGITAHAQQAMTLWVQKATGEQQMIETLHDLKLTFSQGNMIATLYNGSQNTFSIADITKLYFGSDDSAVRQLPAEEVFLWSPLARELTVNCQPGTLVNIYDASGRCVSRTIQSIAKSPISLSALPKGVYIVEAAGQSVKIAR